MQRESCLIPRLRQTYAAVAKPQRKSFGRGAIMVGIDGTWKEEAVVNRQCLLNPLLTVKRAGITKFKG